MLLKINSGAGVCPRKAIDMFVVRKDTNLNHFAERYLLVLWQLKGDHSITAQY